MIYHFQGKKINKETHVEEFCLEPGEGAANSQVQLLACIDAPRLVLIRSAQVHHRRFDVFVGDCREMSSINVL